MKRGLAGDEGVEDERPKRGSYPPDIARRRRELGLPVTPEEHAAYARREWPMKREEG